jgi:ELWxxDGT repeat protein
MVFFTAASATGADYQLWRSDGSAAGTSMVADIVPGSGGSWPAGFTLAGGYLFFTAYDLAHGQELWAIRSGVDARLASPSSTPIWG